MGKGAFVGRRVTGLREARLDTTSFRINAMTRTLACPCPALLGEEGQVRWAWEEVASKGAWHSVLAAGYQLAH